MNSRTARVGKQKGTSVTSGMPSFISNNQIGTEGNNRISNFENMDQSLGFRMDPVGLGRDPLFSSLNSPAPGVGTDLPYGSYGKGGWEDDETVQQAAVREAMDVAGVRGDLMASLGVYDFKSRTLQDEYCPEGLCKAEMFALLVKEELQTWPEQSTRKRSWLTIPEALGCCRHPWMRKALEEGFVKWHAIQATGITESAGEGGEDVESPTSSGSAE